MFALISLLIQVRYLISIKSRYQNLRKYYDGRRESIVERNMNEELVI